MRTPLTTRLRRLLRGVALAAGLTGIAAPVAHAEDVTPQAADANAAFLAYAPPPPVPMKVCVVDTGVDLTTDVAPNVVARYSMYGGTLDDVGGSNIAKHGTYVAGIIASRLDGQASVGIWPQAQIMSVRVFPDRRSGSSVGAYLQALDACRDAGTSVVNLSLSGLDAATGPELDALANRVTDLRLTGNTNTVAAAGNTGGEIGYPGRFPGALTVGASDSVGSLCPFSGRGPELDLSARGCGVAVSMEQGRLGVADGTSYSTPVVSAALAALRAYSGLGAIAAENLLLSTAYRTAAGSVLDTAAAFRAAGLNATVDRLSPAARSGSSGSRPPTTVPRQEEAVIASDPLNELGVRPPRLRSVTYRRGALRVAVYGVPDFGRAVFTVGPRRYTRASGTLMVRARRRPRRVSVVIDVPEVGRTRALIVHVRTARSRESRRAR